MASREHNCVSLIADRLFRPRMALMYLQDGSLATTPLKAGERVDYSKLTPKELETLKRVDGFDVATREYVLLKLRETVEFLSNQAPVRTATPDVATPPVQQQTVASSTHHTSMLYSDGQLNVEKTDIFFFYPTGITLPMGSRLVCLFANAKTPAVTKHEILMENVLTGESVVVFSCKDSPNSTTHSRRVKLMNETVVKDTVAVFKISPPPMDKDGKLVAMSIQLILQLPA